MRVLLLSHSSAVENLGGAERSMLELMDGWMDIDPQLELMVVARTPAGLLQPELERRGIQWMMLPFNSWVLHRRFVGAAEIYNAAREDFATVRALERLVREFKPDVVVSNTIVAPWAAVAAKLVGVPHVWFAHEYGDDHEFALPVSQTFEDIGTLSDLVVTSSRQLREYLATWIEPEKIDVLYPILALPRMEQLADDSAAAATAFPGDTSALRVVCVGRIAETKGQARVVRAVGRLKKKGIRIELALVGSATDTERASIDRLIDEEDVSDRVVLTGEVSNPLPVIDRADVGVVASDSEGFGRSTVECMALGKPVIGAGVGATVELIVDGRTGMLVPPEDIDALCDALGVYAADRGLAHAHGVAARRHVQDELSLRHTLPRIVNEIERIAARDAAPLDRLPHLLMSWMNLPDLAIGLLESTQADIDPRDSRVWRVGSAVVGVPRRLSSLFRSGRRRG